MPHFNKPLSLPPELAIILKSDRQSEVKFSVHKEVLKLKNELDCSFFLEQKTFTFLKIPVKQK